VKLVLCGNHRDVVAAPFNAVQFVNIHVFCDD